MKLPGSASDPLWYKDAIIYELHVRAFYDSNNDGIGDLRGLMEKLDYIQDLGVTCLWLLPLFPSPMRDDGYDISDYMNIHPDYGTLEDFQALLHAAHERGLQVMIELVLSHTSDQHAWFQAARRAPAGSAEREFYVWSDTDEKYRDARIIFTDTEKSNWTWDPVAKAYYWHRFFSHQPDLNFDNPAVVEEVLKTMRHWLDLGVDGLRLDAIPYLVEREGTNCENLPETHRVIKGIRAEMDNGYANRVILAEANQWPSDVRPYFGDGDECHMAFHFPLMPRIFMALRLEDRVPITDIIGQTPEIPDNCQWALFLRNHDELTLEMVSEEERDYMYLAYSADPRMRINIGIRRRLAPLMDNNRRRIELLNSLLFSFPGTPILYYGDEIGMGDNVYLGDRNGVRTPMQWNADRNAGFSRATPARLYSPLIMDPVYGYEAVNVEAQQSDPSSLLSWMRNMIALRKLFRVFGRGSLEFLQPSNRKVLAYLRRYEGEQVLCVANLSRFAQPVELDLAAFEGMRPVEMLGYVEFPVIGRRPYPLTPGPYAFMWFELQPQPEPVVVELGRLRVDAGLESLLTGEARERLESDVLPRFLPTQRWFGGKARRLQAAPIIDWAVFDDTGPAVVFVEARYEDGGTETYLITLAMSFEPDAAIPVQAILCPVSSPHGDGVVHDAAFDEASRAALLGCVEDAREIRTRSGVICGSPSASFSTVRGPRSERLAGRSAPAEQSNTSIVYGDRLILKLFRRLEHGPNPDCEIGRYLTEQGGFEHVPRFAGTIEYVRNGSEAVTIAMLQALVTNQGDAWTRALETVERFYEECSSSSTAADADRADGGGLDRLLESPEEPLAREYLGLSLDSAAMLGRRTAEMHLVLASPTSDAAFAPVPMTQENVRQLGAELHDHASRVFDGLKDSLPLLSYDVVELARQVLGLRGRILGRFKDLGGDHIGGLRTRIHGDYHLGQVVCVKNDYVILDFEGEPARSLVERRTKHSPLKDVAGMLRSYSYAAWVGLLNYTARRPDDIARLESWARLWERASSAAFLRAYRQEAARAAFMPASREGFRTLLEAYLLDKVLYEILYELNNRPGWVRIPLRGLLALQS